jgi:hypothetical protein
MIGRSLFGRTLIRRYTHDSKGIGSLILDVFHKEDEVTAIGIARDWPDFTYQAARPVV